MGKQWGFGLSLFFIIIFFIGTMETCLGVENVTMGCFEEERLALLKLKHSFREYHNMLSSWIGSRCCLWERVRCDRATGHVVHLDLRGTRDYYALHADDYYPQDEYYLVADEVNSALAGLMHLKYLDLSRNYFRGSRIPEFIGSLKQMRYLDLSFADFSGIIPHHLGNLSNLIVLNLGCHPVRGPIARYVSEFSLFQLIADDVAWVSALSSLKHLDLSGVALGQAQNFDKVLYMIPSLIELSLSDCGLFSTHLGFPHLNSSNTLPTIKHLDLSWNSLGDQFPYFIQNMTSLAFLDVSGHNLSQPHSVENILNMIPSLSELHVSDCNLLNTHLNFSITSNMSSLRVLDLSSNSLDSSIPVMPGLVKLDLSENYFEHIEQIGIWNLCHLKQLILEHNFFEGELVGLSTNLSKCSQYSLELLFLGENQFSGSIPESLGRLTALKELRLDSNQLTGPIPVSIGKLTSLERLDLSHNCLTGPIPTSIGKLRALKELYLGSNLLTGHIPVTIGQLVNLWYFDVSNNSLDGVLSESHFSNLSMLKYIDATSNFRLTLNISYEWIPPFQLRNIRLGSCKISAEFPQWIRTQRELAVLVLSNASISGPLPTWLRKMDLIQLDLSHNKISGPLTNIPCGNLSDVFRAYSLQSLSLQNNLFNGSIPKSLCKMSQLHILDLSKNRLFGNIPECLEIHGDLYFMAFSSNALSGVIPSSLGHNCSELLWLKLNNNNFIGELPAALANCRYLRVIDLGDNEFSGRIPEWIGESLPYLIDLRLHKNNFTGSIPQSLCQNRYLQILDIAHNKLTGSIPHCLGNLSAMVKVTYNSMHDGVYDSYLDPNLIQVMKGVPLEYTKNLELLINMDISSNKLIGEIPEELTKLTLLLGLNLSHNHLGGGIPDSIGNMTSLLSLDFSENQLSGVIPPSIAALNFLSSLNLSHNNLSGRIPTGNQLQTLTDPSIYAGNRGLCGDPPLKNCSDGEDSTTGGTDKVDQGDEPNWFYLDIISGFATGFWGVIGVLLFKKQWRHTLFKFVEVTVDKIHVAVAVRIAKMKRGREAT